MSEPERRCCANCQSMRNFPPERGGMQCWLYPPEPFFMGNVVTPVGVVPNFRPIARPTWPDYCCTTGWSAQEPDHPDFGKALPDLALPPTTHDGPEMPQ